MQVISVKNSPAFGAKLELKGEVPYFAKRNLPYLEELANRVGKMTDTITLKFDERIIESETRISREQGERSCLYTYSRSYRPFEIIQDIDNIKSGTRECLFSKGIGGTDDDYECGQLIEILENLSKISMEDFWEKNQKAQERYDRRHHKGRFEK